MEFVREIVDVRGLRVTVMGLGLFGGSLGVIRFLARQGARVTVTDEKDAAQLQESIDALKDLDIIYRLGGHDIADFQTANLVVVSPAVSSNSSHLREAVARGIPIETEMNLFFKLCRGTVVGITGSNGKTTTTALIGEILKRGPTPSVVGGNIGGSLLDRVDTIAPGSYVVLELSSFQLENLASLRTSPHIAVVTNVTPNHLDRHGTMAAYAEAKSHIVRHQREEDRYVVNADDPTAVGICRGAPSKGLLFSVRERVSPGAFVEKDRLSFAEESGLFSIDIGGRVLPGIFNAQNMAAAALATRALTNGRWDGWRSACEEVFRTFPGVEHRLEFVGEIGGVRYYNDSIATNPESTLAALDALEGPFILIAGGYDKQLPFDALGEAIARRVRSAILLGQTAKKIEEAVRTAGGPTETTTVRTLLEAVREAKARARKGDVVLLSPACASYDMFRNFTERGRLFKEYVR